MILFQVNEPFWEQNEEAGFRQIKIRNSTDVIAVINANMSEGTWSAAFVPMGFSFSTQKMNDLGVVIEISDVLMRVLERPDLKVQELLEYIQNIEKTNKERFNGCL